MSTLLGISGAKRNATVALCVEGRILAACEQERLTRVRGSGLIPLQLPTEALDEVLAIARCRHDDISTYVVSESEVRLPGHVPALEIDHHQAHAATALLTSSFERAAVLVCDSNAERELSVWSGNRDDLQDQQWPWRGQAFARFYSECARLFGLADQEHRLEALARLGRERTSDLDEVIRCSDGALDLDPHWRTRIESLIQTERASSGHAADTASAVQRRIGEMLLEVIAELRLRLGHESLCLAGGLFYNTYFTTLVRTSGIFKDVFVPINPGNAGLAVGTALMVARQENAPTVGGVSPFLGPEFDSHAIKAALDGCKLSYTFVSETQAVDATVEALAQGQLVGWFQGRMEWGHRSLGHRSILANPCSPYVLDNLNVFLRKRELWRSFGVSVREESVSDIFCGPPASPFMQYEYSLRDEKSDLRNVLPRGAKTLRVQTVASDSRLFWMLHKRMEQATGTGVLVNTSFNGFHEPIVCSPRDAIRVFYGTGLDMLVIGNFILRK